MRIDAPSQVSPSPGFGMQVRNLCSHQGHGGLTSLDVLIVSATLAFAVAFALFYLAPSRARASRSACINNVKQIGLALRMFANDNEDRFPWQVATNLGGSREWADTPQVYRHFVAASNELNTPKILQCHYDVSRDRQTLWGALANSNISYFVGLDASEGEAARILSGDSHLTGGQLTDGYLLTFDSTSTASWTTARHNGWGNVGLADGSAQQVDSAGLQLHIKSNTLPLLRLAIP